MTNDDPFCDWLVERAGVSGGTMEQRISVREAMTILMRYDAEKAAAATDDARTANHADTPETPRTDDPRNDQEAYDAAMRRYVETIRHHIADAIAKRDMGQQKAGTIAAHAIAALPKPTLVAGDDRFEQFWRWLTKTKAVADDNWDPTLIDVLDDVIAAYAIAALSNISKGDVRESADLA